MSPAQPNDISAAYKFCPICGAQRTCHEPSRPFRCLACGYTSFFGPVSAVGGVILNEHGKVLLIERARDPGKGKLGMPGGFVDPYETAEESLHREVWEEVGIRIDQLKFLVTFPNCYIYQGVASPVLDIFYTAVSKGSKVESVAASEVSGWMWTDLNETVLARMAFESNRRALQFFLQQPGQAW